MHSVHAEASPKQLVQLELQGVQASIASTNYPGKQLVQTLYELQVTQFAEQLKHIFSLRSRKTPAGQLVNIDCKHIVEEAPAETIKHDSPVQDPEFIIGFPPYTTVNSLKVPLRPHVESPIV
jgi:hypothetical protein